MIPVDFFGGRCRNGAPSQDFSSEATFYLHDAKNRERAYIEESPEGEWTAQVMNPEKRVVTFTGVDNCLEVMRDHAPDELESLCDCILTTGSTLIFVELKDKRRDWRKQGADQLLNTIRLFRLHHSDMPFDTQRACLANKQRPIEPNFSANLVTMIEAFEALGVELRIAATILL